MNVISPVSASAFVVCLVAAFIWSIRCSLGWHPRDQIRMLPGRREKGESVTRWWCGSCQQEVAPTRHKVSVPTLRTLRQQVGDSRARSKVINFEIVRRKDEEVAS